MDNSEKMESIIAPSENIVPVDEGDFFGIDADPDIQNPNDIKKYEERMARRFLGLGTLVGLLTIIASNIGSVVGPNPEFDQEAVKLGISVAAKAIIGTLSATAYLLQTRNATTPFNVKIARAIGSGSANAGFWGMMIDSTLLPDNMGNFQLAVSSVLLVTGLATIGLTSEASHEPSQKIF